MINFKNHKLLVVAPHPDDEVIGCGGLIARIKHQGGKVFVLFLTVGETLDYTKGKRRQTSGRERQKEIEKVARFLKFDGYQLAFLGNDFHLKLDLVGQKELIDVIERKSSVSIEKVKPTIVAFPLVNSYNQDHRAAAQASHASLRPTPKEAKHFVPIVLSFEEAADQWSQEGVPHPNFFVPLSKKELEAKIKALTLYKSQLRPHPSMRSLQTIRALATLRGAQTGNDFAEAFVSYRTVTE